MNVDISQNTAVFIIIGLFILGFLVIQYFESDEQRAKNIRDLKTIFIRISISVIAFIFAGVVAYIFVWLMGWEW